MEEALLDTAFLEDICRLCLGNKSKDSFKIYFKATEAQKKKFEDVTGTRLLLSNKLPKNICSDCSDHLENFYFYKHQLIRKQNELLQFLKITEKQHEDELKQEDQRIDENTEEVLYEVEDFLEMKDDNSDCEMVDCEEEYAVDEEVSSQAEMDEAQNYDGIDLTDSEIEYQLNSSAGSVQRLDEIKYEKKEPKAILTAAFLKAREALKNKPSESCDGARQVDYIEATLITSDSTEALIYICSDSHCKAEFRNETEMKFHMLDHKFESGPQKCDFCSLVFKTRHFYERHIENLHSTAMADSQFVCQICGKSLKTKVQWRSHLRNHDQTLKYKCQIEGCTKAFRVKHHLDNHLRVHTKDSPFACDFEGCSARFRQKHALTIHKRKHTGDFVSCETCKSPFVTQFQLQKHFEKCTGMFKPLVTRAASKAKREPERFDTFKCPIDDCDESFKAKVTLEKHLRRSHQIDVTPTLCVICCQEFDTQQALKSHLRDHLPFTCKLCSMNFKNEDNFNNHLLKNHKKNDIRLHNCSECPAAFKRMEHLRAHTAYKHTSERAYSCDKCSYVSPTIQDLNSHFRAHTKEADHLCTLCDFRSKNLSTLSNHLKTKHDAEYAD